MELLARPPAAEDSLRLEAVTLPAPFILKGGKNDIVLDASGVEPIGEGKYYFVAHDKSPALHVVEAATGRHVGEPLAPDKFPAPNKSGPKWEGMARDDEGRFYLIGAHNGKTDEESARPRAS